MMLPRVTRASPYVLGLSVLFMVLVAMIAASLLHDRSDDALRESEARANRFISGAEAAINRNFLSLDIMLASLDGLLQISTSKPDWIQAADANDKIRNAMRQNLLASRIALVSPDGRSLASSDPGDQPVDLRLPEGFLAEIFAQPVSSLVFSVPVVSFMSSETVLYAGRVLRFGDGTRIAAIAEVQVPQLTGILVQGVDIQGLEATIERANGDLLAASPTAEPRIGARLTPPLADLMPWDGTREHRSRLTRQPAYVVVRATLYNGLFLSASIPYAAVLQESQGDALLIWSVAAVLILMISASTAVTLWYLSRLSNARQSMARSKEVLDQALESMVSGFVLLDARQQVLSWNRRYLELHPWLAGRIQVGTSFETLATITARHLQPLASDTEIAAWVQNRLSHLRTVHESRQVVAPDGLILEVTERSTPDGGMVIVYQDVTRLRQAVADVEMLAFYDPLTGLPNRRLLQDRLKQALHACSRSGRCGALLFLDLDHFKTLNDTAGHLVGDMLLQQVAQRLRGAVRDDDTVARLGGDEFVVMLQSLSGERAEAAAQTRRVAETILASLNKPYLLQDVEHSSSSSIGATLFGPDAHDAADLLKQADIAMYQVKTAGRNGLCFFDPEMLASITVRADIERDLRHALAERQFELHYQVQTGENGHPFGAEVLIRWRHPEKGLISPAQFIAVAEETGLIVPMGDWVLRTACQQLKAWESVPAADDLRLAVNVSARQFRSPDFVQRVRRKLQETGARPHLLELELTESLVLDNIKDAIRKMEELKALGVRFSMDDFGTGYSSLAYLTRLPLSQLKIDQSFVRNIGHQASDSAVIDTIIGLARSLDLEVIAEGVETTEQRDFLNQHGCQLCQGYLFGKPMPLHEFEAWLVANRIAF